MAELSAQTVDSDGEVLTEHSADGAGDTIPFGATVIFRNSDAATKSVTVETPASVDNDLDIADRVITVEQNAVVAVKPNRHYRDEETERVTMTYDAVTGLTLTVTI